MNLVCIICSDGIAPSSEVYATYCGHLFHYHCLIQWIERSKTCPQCRCKATEKTIHRVYFNQSNADCNADDITTLQSKLDNLQFQLMLKGKDVTNLTEKYNKVKHQNVTLRAEVSELTNKTRAHESVVHALKDQISFFKSKTKERDKLAEELTKLRTRMKQMESIDVAVNGSREEVNEMLKNENDVDSLTILVATLKKALLDSEKKKINMEHKFKHLQNDVTKYRREITFLELSNKEFKKEVLLQATSDKETASKKNVKTTVGQNQSLVIMKNSADKFKSKSPPLSLVDCKRKLSAMASPSLDQQINNLLDSNSPYLCIKKGNTLVQEKPKYLPKSVYPQQMSILKISKKTTSNVGASKSENVMYNGLGGQSKEDPYPSSSLGIKRHRLESCSYSTKLRKLDSVVNCKK